MKGDKRKKKTRALLGKELSALRRRLARMERSARTRKEAGQGKVEHDLREREKELACLYGILQLLESCDNSLDGLLQGIADLLPPSWQYPKVTCARVIFNGRRYATAGFRRTRWKQAAVIKLGGEKIGAVEVYYRKKMPDSDEGPFLKGERVLIDAVAEGTGRIAERLWAEEALLKAAEEWRSTFDAIGDPVCLLNAEGRVLRCNKAMVDLLGKPFSDIIGLPCYEAVHPTRARVETCPFLRVKGTRRRENSVIEMGDRWFDVAVDPLLDDVGNVIGAVHIMADITDRKRAEEEIRRANRELQAEHTALQTVLARIEDEKAAIREDILANVDKVLMPILHAMEAEVSPEQKGYVALLKRNLEEMTTPFVGRLTKAYLSLTPAETQVCNMIRQGLTSKEIAQLRHVSPVTVRGQRERIRRKLGIANKKVNLATYLQAFESGQDRLGAGGQGSALQT